MNENLEGIIKVMHKYQQSLLTERQVDVSSYHVTYDYFSQLSFQLILTILEQKINC